MQGNSLSLYALLTLEVRFLGFHSRLFRSCFVFAGALGIAIILALAIVAVGIAAAIAGFTAAITAAAKAS